MSVRLGPIAAGNRDVELGVTPHAVFRDVETGSLRLRLDADPPEPLHHPERSERGGEGEAADRDETQRLDAELVEGPRVDEPTLAGGEIRRQRRTREDPGRQGPPPARHSVYRHCADGIVDPDPFDEQDA